MNNLIRISLISLLIGVGPSFSWAGTKKATPLPKGPSPNLALMQKTLKLWVFEKGGEFIGDVVGIVDQKEKKVVLKCGLKNLTPKTIHGVRGVIRFTTLFNEYIGDISVESTAVIPAGQSISMEWKAGADRFTPEGMKKFQKLKLEEMRQLWYPSMIVFEDGTTLK